MRPESSARSPRLITTTHATCGMYSVHMRMHMRLHAYVYMRMYMYTARGRWRG